MREFSKVSCTVAQSKKLRELSHAARWAWLCAIASPFAGYCGLFRYPIALWADDAGMPIDDLNAEIHTMQDIGLIDWDEDEKTVRLIGWWSSNLPKNADHAIGCLKELSAMDQSDLQARCLVEFVFTLWPCTKHWKDDSVRKLLAFLEPTVAEAEYSNMDAFTAAAQSYAAKAAKWVLGDLSAVFPNITAHPADTMGNTMSTRWGGQEEGEEDKDKEEEKTKTESPLALLRKGPLPETVAISQRMSL